MRNYLSGFARPMTLAAALGATTALVAPAAAQQGDVLPTINVNATRLINDNIVGASTSVITAEEINRASNLTLQEIIARVPGAQLQNFYGGVSGIATTVDLRGFGAFAAANTLVLINGRRINDIDLAGVDFTTVPRDSIERIEVTRGNSGAVLYGDNAVGGVINIITKTGAATGKPVSARAEAGVGSFNTREGSISLTTQSGPWSTAVFANSLTTDGYRENNKQTQRNAVGEIRYIGPQFSAFLNLSADDQHLGLPGARYVNPALGINELVTDPRGATTPRDYADKQGLNATAGFTYRLSDTVDLIVDGGVRSKKQQGAFFSPFAEAYVDSALQTWSVTPRLDIRSDAFGLRSRILTGLDYYDAAYDQTRSQFRNSAPIHIYNLSQRSFATYWQQTLGLSPATDFSYGGRWQLTSLSARDKFNPLAPGAYDAEHTPLDTSENNYALHIGLDHRINGNVAVFARAARAFRTPNVDERLATGPGFDINFNPIPQTFALKTQTSFDVEGGVRLAYGPLNVQSSLYYMELTNEIHFDPVNFYNYNLDPTRRYGSETSASFRINDDFLLKGSIAYTRAQFREGQFAGNDVPLVSRLTGSAGFSWNIMQKQLVLDATARFWSARYMDNDQANKQGKIPANATVDLKLGGEIDRFFWSVSVNNLFNTAYYDYAVASAYTPGAFNAYPLPGRTYLLKAGFKL
ncbi:MAG TPA: TonB-dependent receptor [Xanthobacteraceae bacterium]|nr:TonB-dependent receptor [Xanthobacteraceae bacterium]